MFGRHGVRTKEHHQRNILPQRVEYNSKLQ